MINDFYGRYEVFLEGVDIVLIITLVPKVWDNVFLFVGFTTLGPIIELKLVSSKVSPTLI